MPINPQTLAAAQDGTATREQLAELLSLTDPADVAELYAAAYATKKETVGTVVHFRGIVEFSNVCVKDCLYCGIRKSNTAVERFTMTEDEIVEAALWAFESEYGSIVIQGGERQDPAFVEFIERALLRIKKESGGKLGVTLSLGEQSLDTFRRWFIAGAHRYLLRIESSNRELYNTLHPETHTYDARIQALADLRTAGYQVGTGVMIGFPGQTALNLADDVLFFRDKDIDMIGMGPYIVHEDTPMAKTATEGFDGDANLELGLKMIAVTRLFLRDVNIAAATALQALNPTGRELGLQAGANIIMPNITETKYRSAYQLYNGKPCLDENSTMCRGCLQRRIDSIGETIGFNNWGDSPHFAKRTGK